MTAHALPIIDLRGLSEGSAGLGRVASEVGRAFRETGFFHAVHAPATVGDDFRARLDVICAR